MKKKFKFTIRGNEYDVEIQNLENNVVDLEINGTQYSVEIHQEKATVSAPKTPKLTRTQVPEPKRSEQKLKKNISGSGTAVAAPLPGTILKVFVASGDPVKKGDKLLIMEAMKMENEILAEKDGTITSVQVREGDTVLQGDAMLEIA